MEEMRLVIQKLIRSIVPWDALEKEHVEFACSWISLGAPIFRMDGAAYPDPHLIAYFVVLDLKRQKILLTDHKKARLWIPTGGHIEINEHPIDTVKREIQEELGLKAHFISDKPFFLTVTQTKGPIKHTDVSLWYLLKGDSRVLPHYDVREFNEVRWFYYGDKILREKSDPHMIRFLQKLENQKNSY